jgi:hypothetical protein
MMISAMHRLGSIIFIALFVLSFSALADEDASYFDSMVYLGQPMDAILMPWYDVTDTEKFVCLLTGGPNIPASSAATAAHRSYLSELTVAIQADRTLIYQDDNMSQYMYQTSWYVEAPYSTELPDSEGAVEDIVIPFELYLIGESGVTPQLINIIQDQSATNYITNYEGASGFDVFYINHTDHKRYVNFSVTYQDKNYQDHEWSVEVVEKEI